MSESKIEQELLAATALKPKKNEERDAYLRRLMLAVSKLKDPEWEQLSTESQEWTNGAAEAHKAGDEIEEFPDFAEEDTNPPADEEVDEEAEPEPVKPKAKEKAAKSEKKEVAPQSNRKVSACHTIKKIVVQNPKITVAELSEELKEAGLKVSDVTISTLRSDLRDTLRVMNELKIHSFEL